MNDLNKKLLDVQQVWKNEIYNTVLQGKEGIISCPFSFGVSDKYLLAHKKVMIVGQAARGHTCEYDKQDLPTMQNWAVEYFESQMQISTIHQYNPSPFWRFFRALKQDGLFPCWNNIDKVSKYVGSKEQKIDNIQREILNGKLSLGSSLLQKEIELAQPDAVILTIGPNDYSNSLFRAFDVDKDTLWKLRPTTQNFCSEISTEIGLKIPTFWTYHPRYLSATNFFDKTIANIVKSVN